MEKEKLYELWELYKDGVHGEIYEVAECSVDGFVGNMLKIHKRTSGDKQFLSLVEITHPDDRAGDETMLITLYGCLGTAKYKKVDTGATIKHTDGTPKHTEGETA